jgi:hypothetical protein
MAILKFCTSSLFLPWHGPFFNKKYNRFCQKKKHNYYILLILNFSNILLIYIIQLL